MQNEVQLIVRAGAISPTYGTDLYIQAANGQDYFESGSIPLAAFYPNGSKVEFYNNTTSSVEFTTYVVSTDDNTGRVYINPPFRTAPDENDGIDVRVYAFIGANTFLDLYPNESISLSYQFTDLNNFSQIGTFSRDFRIPATKRNVEALGPLYDYNFVDDVQSFSRKYTAELRVDTIPISRGYIRVMAAYKQQDYLSDFQVAFYSEAPNFVKELGEKKLKDLTDLPNINESINFANVTTINSTRIWAVIDRAQNNKAFSELGEANTQPIQQSTNPLNAGQLTPCLRADYILNQIFTDAGFEIDATNLQTILSEYYVPWINKPDLQYEITASDLAFRVQNSSNINFTSTFLWQTFPFNLEDFDNNGDYNLGTQTYTAPYAAYCVPRVVLLAMI